MLMHVVDLEKFLMDRFILSGGTGILNQVLLLLFFDLRGIILLILWDYSNLLFPGFSHTHFLHLGLLIFTSNNTKLSE
jgi:hypothetical protein